MTSRRKFIKHIGLGTAGITLINNPLFAAEDKTYKITILHTNDMHSRIQPFNSGRNKGVGGMAQRSNIIKNIRIIFFIGLIDYLPHISSKKFYSY